MEGEGKGSVVKLLVASPNDLLMAYFPKDTYYPDVVYPIVISMRTSEEAQYATLLSWHNSSEACNTFSNGLKALTTDISMHQQYHTLR